MDGIRVKRLIGAAALAALVLTGCQASKNVKPITAGGITGLQYDPADPANDNLACWRVTFTDKGQISYDCADPAQWQTLKLGDWYRANGLADDKK
jgi:hypothetical protein